MIKRFQELDCYSRLMLVSVVVLAASAVSIAFVDVPVAEYVRSLDPATRELAEPVTTLGKAHWPLITLALVTGYFCWRRRWALANRSALVFCAISMTLVVHLFKLAFGRARPAYYFKQAEAESARGFNLFRILDEGGPYADYASYPSGHCAVAGALAVSVWLVSPAWLRWPVAVLAVLIAASRVMKNSHWVGDTLAGLLLGALCAVILHRRFKSWGWLDEPAGLFRSKPVKALA